MLSKQRVLSVSAVQVVVICGRNKKLLSELKGTVWPGGTHVVACGFVDNIHEVRSPRWVNTGLLYSVPLYHQCGAGSKSASTSIVEQ